MPIADIEIHSKAIDAVGLFMIAIKAQFILYPQQYDNRACHPHRKTGDVDEGVGFVAPDVAHGHYQVVFEHN